MGLPRSHNEGDGSSNPISKHIRFGAIATTKSPKRLTCVSLSLSAPFPSRPRRLLARTNAGAVEERHPELNSLLLRQPEKALPHSQASPGDEGLSRL
jgi:hypothetical protein